MATCRGSPAVTCDLALHLIKNRIVFVAVSIVSTVAELVMAELMPHEIATLGKPLRSTFIPVVSPILLRIWAIQLNFSPSVTPCDA